VAHFELASAAFGAGQPIPARRSCDGEDVSPRFAWTEPSEGMRSLALVVDDPDAPGGTFTHWLAWDVDPARSGLAEGEAPPAQGRNDFGRTGYGGPCPPRGHRPHRSSFRLMCSTASWGCRRGATMPDVERTLATDTCVVIGADDLEEVRKTL
jgi:Raf kinase inhibitor-like YbhB/YbcL family protein